ncbi:MAG: exopolysaccharide biosynthesis polyprenyl glycosylphosphotransferase [Solirubrobacterales bacterium]|nr:exopolysaccharide biosynthesis polyprenyl glycosylphosphotransferase [Solirubrobacterales bacterium]
MQAAEADGVTAIRVRETIYRRGLLVADVVATLVALYVSVVLLGEDLLKPLTLVIPVLVVGGAKLTGLYDRDELLLRKSTVDELPRLFQLATLTAFVIWLLSPQILAGTLGQGQALALWMVLTASLAIARAGARRAAAHLASVERVMVVGDAVVLSRLREKLEADAHVELVGSVPFEHVVDNLDEMSAQATRLGAHRLIVAPGDGATVSPEAVHVIKAAKATGLRVSLLPGVLDVVGTAVEFDSLSGMTLLGVRRFGLTKSSHLIKRALDVVLGGLIVALTAPLMLAIAVAVKLDSRGPVFFRQPRIGQGGRTFQIIKFRSMVEGADTQREALSHLNEAQDGLFKIADDPRITRVGAFLRRASLDELPQLFNVMRGEMSLVGPRPLIADEDVRIVGSDRQRLQLTPGMTGQWQIAGSARVPLSEMVKIDYLYVAGWSLWSDVKILIRTALYVVGRRGQ